MRMPSLENFEDLSVPSFYQIRTYREGDEESWMKIIQCSLMKNFPANAGEIFNSQEFGPDGLFFVTYQRQPAGTVFARRQFIKGHKVIYSYVGCDSATPREGTRALARSFRVTLL